MRPSSLAVAFVAALAACSSEPNRGVFGDAAPADDASVPTDDLTVTDVATDAAPDAPRDVPVDQSAPDAAAAPDVRDAGGSDARPVGPDVPDFEDGGIVGPTYDFVLTQFVIDGDKVGTAPHPAIHTQGVAGFNLDGRFTGATARDPEECQHGDFFSALDADQNMGTCTPGAMRGGSACTGGVDNQLPEIADTVNGFGINVRNSIAELLSTGQTVILVRVSGVDGALGPTLNDDQVTVRVYPVGRPMFSDCARIGTPGLEYAVDDASLAAPGDFARARYRFNGRIVAGRLITAPTGSTAAPDFGIDLPLGTAVAPLSLYRTQLRFDLTMDRANRGNLGGSAPLREVVDAIVPALPSGISPAIVTTVVQSFVDIQDPAGSPTGCRAPNGSIGMGLGFAGVRATIVPMTVRGPQPGRCGS
jgi:hypothetical protein